MADPSLDDLIACPVCDTLHHARMPQPGERAVCQTCHHVLIAPRRNAYLRVIALAVTVMVLMIGAVTFPFLAVNVQGFSNRASVIDTALVFIGQGADMILVVFVAGFIVAVPVLRAALAVYTLIPLAMGAGPFRFARGAFRAYETLRPWSMAEIFIIGTAVALVKVSDLARVEYGPAFWMFAAMVVTAVFQDTLMCRWTIWRALERRADPVPGARAAPEPAE